MLYLLKLSGLLVGLNKHRINCYVNAIFFHFYFLTVLRLCILHVVVFGVHPNTKKCSLTWKSLWNEWVILLVRGHVTYNITCCSVQREFPLPRLSGAGYCLLHQAYLYLLFNFQRWSSDQVNRRQFQICISETASVQYYSVWWLLELESPWD